MDTKHQSSVINRMLFALALLVSSTTLTSAQTFPNKPVHIVIGFPPGGAIDTIARVMAPKLSIKLGQSVVIENKGGAGGVIGMQSVAKAEPDGYTLFFGTLGNFAISPAIVKDLPYQVQKDFKPITEIASSPFLIFVNPQLPVKTVPELIAYAKANPKGVNFSSSGNGGLPHMAGEMFNDIASINMTHVPYKGSAPSIIDVIGGQVQVTFEAVAIGLQHLKTGKLRAIASTDSKRLQLLPEVPTVSENLPDFVLKNWFGIAAPANVPDDRIKIIHAALMTVLQDPDVLKTFREIGVDPVGNTPAQFASGIKSETERWQRIITKANIKLD